MYGEGEKRTTVSVRLGADDLAALDALCEQGYGIEAGPDPRYRWWAYGSTSKRGGALREALRQAAEREGVKTAAE